MKLKQTAVKQIAIATRQWQQLQANNKQNLYKILQKLEEIKIMINVR